MRAKTQQDRTHNLVNNANPTFFFMLEEKKNTLKKKPKDMY